MGLDVTGKYRYPQFSRAWLAQRVEAVIDPERPIIDAHHHLWEQDGQPYLLQEMSEDVGDGHAIVATVFVQANYGYRTGGPDFLRCVGETECAAAVANQAALRRLPQICEAIVGYADLTLGARVNDVIEAHLEAGQGRFRGVRHSVSRDALFPDGIVLRPAREGLLADAAYREGLARLPKYGLSYDAMLYHRQIPELTAMAAALPDLSIVLDHFGCIIGVGPYEGREKESFLQWRADLAALAARPNVSVKLGGMGMIICGARWHEQLTPPGSEELAEAWRPYIETCIELFGVERCMFESNFPVDKSQFSYRTLWNAFKRVVEGVSDAEKSALFHDNAARIYRIEMAQAAVAYSVRGQNA